MSSTYRESGRRVTANDLAERLLPDLHMNEFIAWPPDLFALTSYILNYTGAYQLVISPPTGEKWPPTSKQLCEWLGLVLKDDELQDDKKELESLLTSWLNNILSKDSADKNRNSWELDCEDWTPFSKASGSYFNEPFVQSLKDWNGTEKQTDIQIKRIVGHISEYIYSQYYTTPDSKLHSFRELLKEDNNKNWTKFVQSLGNEWKERLNRITDDEFQLINHSLSNERGVIFPIECEGYVSDALSPEDYDDTYHTQDGNKKREKRLLGILLKYTPPLILACWAFFYNQIEIKRDEKKFPLNISDLLCNRDEIQLCDQSQEELWKLCQCIFTLHAIADICCVTWGIYPVDEKTSENSAQWFAEMLLFDKGSLSTANPERGRVLPKRHNPSVGITLRSISSNIAFNRSSVEVVWRKTSNTPLEKKLTDIDKENLDNLQNNKPLKAKALSILLFPFPLEVRAVDFREDKDAENIVDMLPDYGFFEYAPQDNEGNPKEQDPEQILRLIKEANNELVADRKVDFIIFPEGALSATDYKNLEEKLLDSTQETPSVFISGVRESRVDIWEGKSTIEKRSLLNERKVYLESEIEKETVLSEMESLQKALNRLTATLSSTEVEQDNTSTGQIDKKLAAKMINFSRNAVYCKYFNSNSKNFLGIEKNFSRKYKQYKHHRWQLNSAQIKTYGLSQILSTENNMIWWESMKVPRRRVSFLNVGKNLTVAHLVCEDLARQDPIADLIRHVGPSLVVTLLMDGPQLKDRWSSRYASVLSDDPGASVITLTSWGMVKRYQSPYGLMSKVIALWSESGGGQRQIELAEGAQAVLLNLMLDTKNEKTADGRTETVATTILKLVDVIQIYPKEERG